MAMLQRFAELALSSAEDLHARQLSPEAAELAGALHAMGRSLRQTLALEARLERDAAREAEGRAVARRRSQARAAVERLIYSEAETEGREEELEAVLDEALDSAQGACDFLDLPLQTFVERLCVETGVPYRAPEPPDGATAAPGSSAAPVDPPPRLIQMPDYGWSPAPDSS